MKNRLALTKTRNAATTLFLSLFSTAALAAQPFATGSSTLTADILAIVTPIVGLGLIGAGVLCWFGKMAWSWFAALVVGVVLVFGHQQIIGWIRAIFGV